MIVIPDAADHKTIRHRTSTLSSGDQKSEKVENRKHVKTYMHRRMEHCTLPISCLDQLYSTKVLLTMNQDCDSSFLLPCDSRQDSLHHFAKLSSVHEEYSMPKLDTSFHLQLCSTFPCTHVLVESLYNLHKVNIHTF